MPESIPHWVEPDRETDSRLAIDLIAGERQHSRLWFFIHGLNSHRRGEKASYFAQEVAARGEAFASLDLTGHGDSEGDLVGLSLTRNLSDLERGLRCARATIGPFSAVNLVGSSMGGLTALWFSALHPGTVKANLLIAPAFEMAGRLLLALGPRKAARWRREGTIRLQTEFAEFDLSYEFVADQSRYLAADLLQRLDTPTLIFHGSDDETVPCNLSRRFAARHRQVRLLEVEGGDHRLTEHKERLFEEMWDFVGPPEWIF